MTDEDARSMAAALHSTAFVIPLFSDANFISVYHWTLIYVQ